MPANLGGMLLPILLLVFFYFFLFVPEQKKQKKAKALIDSLKVGDSVMTRGGIYGKITDINEEVITLATGPDNIRITLSKYSIANVINESEAEKIEKPEEVAAAENKEEKAE